MSNNFENLITPVFKTDKLICNHRKDRLRVISPD